MLRHACSTAQEFLFPPTCLVCGAAIAADLRLPLCHNCTCDLKALSDNRCSICSAEIGPHLKSEAGCIHCQRERFAFRSVVSLGNYRNHLQQCLIRAKSGSQFPLARCLTDLLLAESRTRIESWQSTLIVPIPQHWTNRILEPLALPPLIAVRLGMQLQLPVMLRVLRKTRRTPKQTSLPPSKRRTNLRNAFSCGRDFDLSGQRILLVDDVLTTGTTCHRAARVLLAAGADEVRVCVLARGVGLTSG